MFRDKNGEELHVGDEVTISGIGGRSTNLYRSHGEIIKFGTKLAHVKITYGRSERHDNTVHPLEAESLQKGHHGRPRHPDGHFAEMNEMLDNFKYEYLERVLNKAAEIGTITQQQCDELKDLGTSVD